MVSMTGAELKRFYSDPKFWPDEMYHEDEEVAINGCPHSDVDLSTVADDASVTISGGIVYKGYDVHGPTMEEHFLAWRRMQTMDLFLVEVPKDKSEAVKAAVVAAGGKVL